MGRLSVKRPILPKCIYRIEAFLIKILAGFFVEIDQQILKLTQKNKSTYKNQNNFEKEQLEDSYYWIQNLYIGKEFQGFGEM